MKNIKTLTVLRRVIQIAAFLAMPGLFIDTFMGMKSIVTALMSGSFTFREYSFQVMTVATVALITVFAGRIFCSFLCSFGSMGDLAYFLGRKLHLPEIKVPEALDKVLRRLKYGILAVIVVSVWILAAVEIPSTSDPWTVFGMYAKIGTWPGISYMISIGGLLLVIIFVASMMMPRVFCRYLCPLGACLTVLAKCRLTKIEKPTEGCGACRQCTKACPMALELTKMEKVCTGECVNCLACVDACPRGNARVQKFPRKIPAAAVAVLCLAIMAGGYFGGNVLSKAYATKTTTYNESSGIVSDANESTDTGKYKDGTYTGSGSGFRGTTEVKVTVKNGNITAITVTSYVDDQEYFDRCVDVIISEIKDSQGVEVDTVSGATFSSNGIRAAVADALDISFDNPNDSAESGGGHGGPGGY